MTTNHTAPSKAKSEVPSLDRRYGKIGISAVAAALRYHQSEAKTAASAPALSGRDDRHTGGLAA